MIGDPKAWRALSTLLLVAGVAGLLFGGDDLEHWGWLALIASGVTFGIELWLVARQRSSADRG